MGGCFSDVRGGKQAIGGGQERPFEANSNPNNGVAGQNDAVQFFHRARGLHPLFTQLEVSNWFAHTFGIGISCLFLFGFVTMMMMICEWNCAIDIRFGRCLYWFLLVLRLYIDKWKAKTFYMLHLSQIQPFFGPIKEILVY